MKRFFLFIFLLILVFSLIVLKDFLKQPKVTTEEIIREDEQQQAEIAKKIFVEIVEKNKSGYVGRGAHAKGHACVKAYLDVVKDLSPNLQYGIFSEPGQRYKTWIRFSNANSNFSSHHDLEKDAHGMAIKVLTAGQNESGLRQVQDFLMADNPNFFSPDIVSYNEFLSSENILGFFFPGMNPFKWRIREFTVALATLKEPEVSPLEMQFHSNTAYKLGLNNIKFRAKPCRDTDRSFGENDTENPDFLRELMKSELQKGDACFHFQVQLQDPEKYMPLEDPSFKWDEVDSPFMTVAELTLIKQTFDSTEQKVFCENFSFSPWNSLPAHKPVGQFNRIRKHVYQASSDYRHEKNNTKIPFDLDW